MANEDTYRNLPGNEKEKAIAKEMIPFSILAMIPIIITIIITLTYCSVKQW